MAIHIDAVAQRMNAQNQRSNHIGSGTWPNGEQDYLEVVHIQPLMKHLFEEREFYIPVNYDSHLRHFYGDYMQIPPENKRPNHHIEVYRNEE